MRLRVTMERMDYILMFEVMKFPMFEVKAGVVLRMAVVSFLTFFSQL